MAATVVIAMGRNRFTAASIKGLVDITVVTLKTVFREVEDRDLGNDTDDHRKPHHRSNVALHPGDPEADEHRPDRQQRHGEERQGDDETAIDEEQKTQKPERPRTRTRWSVLASRFAVVCKRPPSS